MTGALAAALVLLAGAGAPALASTSTPQVLVVNVLGAGRVTSQPAGISCPNKCKAEFPQGTSVQLTPTTESGSSFETWGGSCTGSGQCTVDMTSLAAVAAQFSPRTVHTSAKAVAVPGSYSGSGLSFWVAPGGRSMVNVVGPNANLQCTPSGAITHEFAVLRVPVALNGSFHTQTLEHAIVSPPASIAGIPVKIVYAISGNLQPATANAPAQATGTWRETVTSTSPSLPSCDSNVRSWSASLNPGPAPSKQLVQSGNYSGPEGSGNALTFSVNAGRNRMLNVALHSDIYVYCSSGTVDNQFAIPQVKIKSDGSFSTQGTTHAVISPPNSTAGIPAKVTYSISGYFEGVTAPNSVETAAGILREDITFASGAVTSCTSNNRTWTASPS